MVGLVFDVRSPCTDALISCLWHCCITGATKPGLYQSQDPSFDRQKEVYDIEIHGKTNDLVWLHSTVVPKGVGLKLHHPLTGPFQESVYRL